jgi:hypothetical protein
MPITGESDYIWTFDMTTENETSKRIEGVGTMEVAGQIEKAKASSEAVETTKASSERSWKKSLLHEVRTHPFGYSVLGLFVLAGPFLAPLLFPQAPPAVAVVGGLAFGLYAALCAVPQKFM